MAAIDTNVLVRLVTKDDARRYEKALAFVERHKPVWVTQLSVLELAWVLLSRYGLVKAEVCTVLRALLDMAELSVQQASVLEAAVDTWEHSKADFADLLILETVRRAAATPLGSFDASLARLEGVERL